MKIETKLREVLETLMNSMHEKRKLILALSCVVVFMTTYVLILPAFTLEKDEAAEQGGIDLPATEAVAEVETESAEETATADDETLADDSETPAAEAKTAAEDKKSEATSADSKDDPLMFKGEEFSVTVNDKNQEMSDSTRVEVTEILADNKDQAKQYAALYQDALQAVRAEDGDDTQTDITFAKFYNITVLEGDEAADITDKVDVTFSYDEALQEELKAEKTDEVKAVQFSENDTTGQTEANLIDSDEVEVKLNDKKVEEASFGVDNSSVVAIVGTETLSTEVITATGETYEISVTYGPEAGIPEGAELEAEEIPVGSEDYAKYYDQTVKAVNSENGITHARFFDIKIIRNGEVLEPKAPVETKISYDMPITDAKEEAALAVHFAEDKVEVLDAVLENDFEKSEFAFEQDSFSVTGTVVKGITTPGEYIIYGAPHDPTPAPNTNVMQNDYYHITHFTQTTGGGFNQQTTYHIGSDAGKKLYNYGSYDTNHNNDDDYVKWTVEAANNGGYLIRSGDRYLSISNGTLTWGTNQTVWQYENNKLSSGNYHIRYNNGNYTLTTNSSQATNMYFAWTNSQKATGLTVHYGEMVNGQFKEWSTQALRNPGFLGDQIDLLALNSSAAESRNYRYVTTKVTSPTDGNDIYFRLQTEAVKNNNTSINGKQYWMYREQSDVTFDYAATGWNVFRTFGNNDKDIYVIYEPQVEKTPDDPSSPDTPASPTAEKGFKSNGDGTYDISLSVSGHASSSEKKTRANVAIVYDVSNSMLATAPGGKTRAEYAEDSIKYLADKLLALNTEDQQDTVELAMVMFAAKVVNEKQVNDIYSYNDLNAFNDMLDNITYTNGTNWDAGLEAAENIRWKDDDPLYVVFISDGDTISHSKLLSSNQGYQWDGGTYHGYLAGNTYYDYRNINGTLTATAYDLEAANSHADVIKNDYKGKIFPIAAFGEGMDNLASISNITTPDGKKYYDAGTNEQLGEAFDSIIQAIHTDLGYEDVSIEDGITDLSSTSLVSGTIGNFNYKVTDNLGNTVVVHTDKDGKITGLAVNPAATDEVEDIYENGIVKLADGSSKQGKITYSITDAKDKDNHPVLDGNGVAIKLITVTVKDTRGNELLSVQTTTASYSSENDTTVSDKEAEIGKKAIKWDLGPLGMLKDKWKYEASFTMWPSQRAYDLVANLNNKLLFVSTDKYREAHPEDAGLPDKEIKDKGVIISAEEAEQVVENNDGTYSLKTNTKATLDYTPVTKVNGEPASHGTPVTGVEIEDPLGKMKLDTNLMTVKKEFAHLINEADPYENIIFYLLVDGKYYQKDGSLSETRNDNTYAIHLPRTVEGKKVWEDDVYIAPGLMRDGEILEDGHNYSLEEVILNGNAYEYEFAPQTVRPMVIEAVPTFLVLKDKFNKNDGDDKKAEYTFDDANGSYWTTKDGDTEHIYYAASENNGSLTGTNHKTSELDITKIVSDPDNLLTPAEEQAETFTYRVTLRIPDGCDPAGIVGYEYVPRTQSNAFTLFGYQTGGDAFPEDITRFNGKTYRAWNTLVYSDLVEFDRVTEDGRTRIVTRRDKDGNIIWKISKDAENYHTITYDMTLKQDEVIRFTNLPSGTKYVIQEIYANEYPADNAGGKTDGRKPVDKASTIAPEGYEITRVQSTGVKDRTAEIKTSESSSDTVAGTITDVDKRYYNQFTNTRTTNNLNTKAELKVKKDVEGYTWGEEYYRFTLKAGTASYSDGQTPQTGTSVMPDGTNDSVVSVYDNTPNHTLSFGTVRYTRPGTYTYTVSEYDNSARMPNVEFASPVTVTVVVKADNNGKLYVDNISDDKGTTTFDKATDTALATGTTVITNTSKKITIKKVDKNNPSTQLDGAVFELSKKGAANYERVYIQNNLVLDAARVSELIGMDVSASGAKAAMEAKGISTQFTIGEIKLAGLTFDTAVYQLHEVSAPTGFVITNADVYFKVNSLSGGNASISLTDENGNVLKGEDDQVITDNDQASVSGNGMVLKIKNEPGAELPSAGGIGTTIFYIIGTLLVTCSAVVLIARRRMKVSR